MKLRYELDPQNRLIIRKNKTLKGPARYRQVLEGEFKIGPRSSLIYEIKTPLAADPDAQIPNKMKFTGNWSLTDNHDLKLTLDRSELQQYRDELILKGEIVSADANSLIFAAANRTLTLKGAWQADEENRLIFKVKKESSSPDSLTFEGGWEVNKSNEIVYRYTKTYLKRKEKIEREIIFRGHWKFIDDYKLIYALELKGDSAFELKFGIGSRIIPKEDAIQFEIGAGLRKSLRSKTTVIASPKGITLYGKWKVNKPLEVSFEVNYGRGIRAELTLSKKLFKGQLEPYLKLSRSKDESGAQLGVAFRW